MRPSSNPSNPSRVDPTVATAESRFREALEAGPAAGGAPARRRAGRRRAGLLALLSCVFVLGAFAAPQLAGAAGYWTAPVNATWQWQLSVPIDQTVDASVYDIDLYENEAPVVASLHAQGRHVICYMDAGTWEGWRPDASKFPASVIGKADPGWTEEKWLDITKLSIIEPLMEARFKLCKEKGFDGIEADNVDGWQNNTGFTITAAQQLTYNEWLANLAHSLGLSIALKSDTQQIPELVPYFDYSVDEECVEYSECSLLEPFVKAGKPVFEVEYAKTPSQFCAEANALGLMAMQKGKNLEAWSAPCWAQGNWVGAKGAAGYDLAGFNGSSDLDQHAGRHDHARQRQSPGVGVGDHRSARPGKPERCLAQRGRLLRPERSSGAAALRQRLPGQPAPLCGRLGLDRPPRDDHGGRADAPASPAAASRRAPGPPSRSTSPPGPPFR